jgi:hypothetical protein
MAGRPQASYAYPKLWTHVVELGYHPSPRALKALRFANGFKAGCGTTFSNRFLETKCHPNHPALIDYGAAHDLVALLNHHRQNKGIVVRSVADEVVRFDHRITGFANFLDGSVSEHADPLGDIAIAAGYPRVVIERAMTGRLLPRQVCAQIVSATRAPQSLSIVHIEPGRRGVPVNETDALTAVFSWLAR